MADVSLRGARSATKQSLPRVPAREARLLRFARNDDVARPRASSQDLFCQLVARRAEDRKNMPVFRTAFPFRLMERSGLVTLLMQQSMRGRCPAPVSLTAVFC